MDEITRKDMEESLLAIDSMISRTVKSKEKFRQGTAQYALQNNRLKALQIASSLISKKLAVDCDIDCYTEEDVKNSFAPITSLISKSEKARTKLAQDSWQLKMLNNYLKALHVALPLLTQALGEQEKMNGGISGE